MQNPPPHWGGSPKKTKEDNAMYISIGPGAVVRRRDLIGIFDLDTVTWSHRTRKSLSVCEQEGRVIAVGEDLPRSMVLCAPQKKKGNTPRSRRLCAQRSAVYLTQLSAATAARRVESERI